MREFTIKDALHHFGWIYGMKNEKIEEKFIFLSELLDLPPANLKIKHLSGGQQRRVSLAVALVSIFCHQKWWLVKPLISIFF